MTLKLALLAIASKPSRGPQISVSSLQDQPLWTNDWVMKRAVVRQPVPAGSRSKGRRLIVWTSLALVSAFAIDLAWAQAKSKTMSVQVKESHLRETPSYLGKILAAVQYCDQVTVEEQQTEWWRVRTGSNQSGWMHSSALSPKKIVLKAGDDNVRTGASAEEVVVASKGFNQQVEQEYRRTKGLDFRWIDEMEKQSISPEAVAQFVREGNLNASGGGGQ